MNLDQLMGSLSENDPNEGTVLGLVYRKRRAARQRMYAAGGGLAVVVVVILGGFLLRGVNLGGAASSSSSAEAAAGAMPAGGGAADRAPGSHPAAVPAASPNEGFSSASASASCAGLSLKDQLTMAVQQGASVIIGYGTASGTSTAGRATGGVSYYQVTLRSVQTLAGPLISSGSVAWVPGSAGTSSAGTSVSPEERSLWAPGGELFAVVRPAAKGGLPFTVLRAAPVAGGQVIFSLDECWSVSGLPSHPYLGSVSQLPVPLTMSGAAGNTVLGRVTRDLYAVPLADVEKVVPKR